MRDSKSIVGYRKVWILDPYQTGLTVMIRVGHYGFRAFGVPVCRFDFKKK